MTLEDFFLNDPLLKEDSPSRYKSYKESYEAGVQKSCQMLKKIRQLQESGKKDTEIYKEYAHQALTLCISCRFIFQNCQLVYQ